jgi:hypothetical protein
MGVGSERFVLTALKRMLTIAALIDLHPASAQAPTAVDVAREVESIAAARELWPGLARLDDEVDLRHPTPKQ